MNAIRIKISNINHGLPQYAIATEENLFFKSIE